MTARQEIRGLKGLKKRRRIQVVGLAFAALAATFVIIYFFVPQSAVNFFRSPSEVVASPPAADEVFPRETSALGWAAAFAGALLWGRALAALDPACCDVPVVPAICCCAASCVARPLGPAWW